MKIQAARIAGNFMHAFHVANFDPKHLLCCLNLNKPDRIKKMKKEREKL